MNHCLKVDIILSSVSRKGPDYLSSFDQIPNKIFQKKKIASWLKKYFGFFIWTHTKGFWMLVRIIYTPYRQQMKQIKI